MLLCVYRGNHQLVHLFISEWTVSITKNYTRLLLVFHILLFLFVFHILKQLFPFPKLWEPLDTKMGAKRAPLLPILHINWVPRVCRVVWGTKGSHSTWRIWIVGSQEHFTWINSGHPHSLCTGAIHRNVPILQMKKLKQGEASEAAKVLCSERAEEDLHTSRAAPEPELSTSVPPRSGREVWLPEA